MSTCPSLAAYTETVVGLSRLPAASTLLPLARFHMYPLPGVQAHTSTHHTPLPPGPSPPPTFPRCWWRSCFRNIWRSRRRPPQVTTPPPGLALTVEDENADPGPCQYQQAPLPGEHTLVYSWCSMCICFLVPQHCHQNPPRQSQPPQAWPMGAARLPCRMPSGTGVTSPGRTAGQGHRSRGAGSPSGLPPSRLSPQGGGKRKTAGHT